MFWGQPSVRQISSGFLNTCQSPLDQVWVPAAVEDRVDVDLVSIHSIVHGSRKAFGEEPVIVTEVQGVDTRVDPQRLDVRVHRVQKVSAYARSLLLIEPISSHQIATGGYENPDLFH